MSDSENNLKLLEIWFDKLVDLSVNEQKLKISQLLKEGVLSSEQAQNLVKTLDADRQNLETSMKSVHISLDSSDNINTQIGNYLIDKSLGEGGMGKVYLAHRNDGEFDQQVALKLPHLDFDETARNRFENERQILAQLKHPNIAILLDGGTTTDHQPYLVMEYVDGLPLDEYCSHHVPDLKQRIRLIIQICNAVSFAHQKLILHRDLKPGNILVSKQGQVKLLDFGIAKLLVPEDESNPEKTATQIMTRNYASPEQITGQFVGTQSDLFSLAVIAYEIITGFHPYQYNSQHEREQKLISGKIKKISSRTQEQPVFPSLSKLSVSKIKGDLENILIKALSPDPQQRYSSVQGFADDLNHFMNHRPVSARKPGVFYYSYKLIQRNKTATLALIFAIFSLIGSTIYSLNQATIARQESKRSQQIAEILQDMFKKARPLPGADDVLAADLLDQALQRLKTDNEVHPDIKYNLMTIIFRSYAYLGKISSLEKGIEGMHSACISELSKFNVNCQNILIYKAYTQHRLGRDEIAVKYYQQAEDIAVQENPVNTIMYLKILRNSFGPLYNTGQKKLGLEKTQKVLQLYKSADEPDLNLIKSTLANLAIATIDFKQFDKALEYINEYKTIVEKLDLKDNREIADYSNLMASWYSNQHLPRQSLPYHEKSIEIYRKEYKVKTQDQGNFMKSYAQALFLSGLNEEAVQQYQDTIQYYDNYGNGQQYRIIDLHTSLAIIYLSQDNVKNAEIQMNEIKTLGLENLTTNTSEQCEFKYLQAYLAILSDSENAGTLTGEFSECVPDGLIKFKIYAGILQALYYQKNNQLAQALKAITSAKEVLEKYPEDYLGMSPQVERIYIKLANNQ